MGNQELAEAGKLCCRASASFQCLLAFRSTDALLRLMRISHEAKIYPTNNGKKFALKSATVFPPKKLVPGPVLVVPVPSFVILFPSVKSY